MASTNGIDVFSLNSEPILVYEETLLNDIEVLDIAFDITNVSGQEQIKVDYMFLREIVLKNTFNKEKR